VCVCVCAREHVCVCMCGAGSRRGVFSLPPLPLWGHLLPPCLGANEGDSKCFRTPLIARWTWRSSREAWGVESPFQPSVQAAGWLPLVCLLLSLSTGGSTGPPCSRSGRPLRVHWGSLLSSFPMWASAKGGEKSSECRVFASLVFISIGLGPERVSKTDPRNPLHETPIWTLTGIRCWVLVGLLKPGTHQALTLHPLDSLVLSKHLSPGALAPAQCPSLLPQGSTCRKGLYARGPC